MDDVFTYSTVLNILSSPTRDIFIHDDVIKWKHFPRYWPFVRVPGDFPAQRPVTRSFDVFFVLRLNKRLNKQSWDWWLETLSRPLWRHRNVHRVSRFIIGGNVSIVSLNGVWNMYPLSTCAFIKGFTFLWLIKNGPIDIQQPSYL